MREPRRLRRRLTDEAATRVAGAALARAARAAGARAFYATLKGELGTGKTTFVRGLLGALGVEGPVPSPTYALLESYEGRGQRVEHFDWYRVESPEELDALGFRDALGPDRWVLVEWPERVPAAAAGADLAIGLAYDPAGRQLEIRALTDAGRGILEQLMAEPT